MKIFDPTGTRTPVPVVIQPVASRYTDWAIPAPQGRISRENTSVKAGGKAEIVVVILVLFAMFLKYDTTF
jgi:hypothetical protein